MTTQKIAQEQQTCHVLQELNRVPIWDILDQDSRPAFVLDLDPDIIGAPVDVLALFPSFGNSALTTHETLWDAARGMRGDDLEDTAAAATLYASFCAWATSRTIFDDSGDVFPATYFFHNILWTGSTVQKRWRLISGNALQTATTTAGMSNLSPGLAHGRGSLCNPISLNSTDDKQQSYKPTKNIVEGSASRTDIASRWNKAASSLAFQFRSEHIGLNAYLHSRRVPGVEAKCSCGYASQNVKHMVLSCPEWAESRGDVLHEARRRNFEAVMNSPADLKRIVKWIIRKG